MWAISVEGSTIKTVYGQVGGKLQETSEVISEGKNLGKANQTTPQEQALAEAQSRWTKKVKKSYVEDPDRASAGETDLVGGVDPMLAQSYDKHAAKIKWPAFVQPKLDGIRMIAVIDNGSCSLWTRTRKPITSLPHIEAELEDLFPNESIILDGEAYNHDLKNDFERIVSAVRSTDPTEDHLLVQYHIYDVVNNAPFKDRLKYINDLSAVDATHVRVVKTQLVESHKALELAHEEAVEEGYEGVMVRNANSPYLNKRSYDLQKVKSMQDKEFDIVGVKEGRGKMAGKAIFVCDNGSGTTFDVKMKGSLDGLTKYLKDETTWKSKQLTVQYQNLTADGIPRFPVGKAIREGY